MSYDFYLQCGANCCRHLALAKFLSIHLEILYLANIEVLLFLNTVNILSTYKISDRQNVCYCYLFI